LKRGDADLAIRSGPILDQELIVRPLGESGWSLYAAPAYLPGSEPSRRSERPRSDRLRSSLSQAPAAQWVEQRVGAASGATVVLRSRKVADMQAAALSGAGLAMLPCLSADDEPGLVRLTPRVLATRQLSLVYPRDCPSRCRP
jgi:DNA-binding transcriptional LysR family regulator